MKSFNLFFLFFIASLIIASCSLTISGIDVITNQQLREYVLKRINNYRAASPNNLKPLVQDATLNRYDEVALWFAPHTLHNQKQFTYKNQSSTNGVLYFESQKKGVSETFLIRAPHVSAAFNYLSQNQQWEKSILSNNWELLGAASYGNYYAFSFGKGNQAAQWDQISQVLPTIKDSIKAQNPTVTSEDLDLSNRISDWLKNGKPMGSILGYFSSISYKAGEKVTSKIYSGSWEAALGKIVKDNYFKINNSSQYNKFGVALDVNKQGKANIVAVFAS